VFIIRLRDLWHKRGNVDIGDEGRIRSLYDELRQQEQAKQSQQSPLQVVILSLLRILYVNLMS